MFYVHKLPLPPTAPSLILMPWNESRFMPNTGTRIWQSILSSELAWNDIIWTLGEVICHYSYQCGLKYHYQALYIAILHSTFGQTEKLESTFSLNCQALSAFLQHFLWAKAWRFQQVTLQAGILVYMLNPPVHQLTFLSLGSTFSPS